MPPPPPGVGNVPAIVIWGENFEKGEKKKAENVRKKGRGRKKKGGKKKGGRKRENGK
jgi:hypothetical protein